MLPSTAQKIFWDTPPLIYLVERHPAYFPVIQQFVSDAESRQLRFAASAITLAEALVVPLREGKADWVERYLETLLENPAVEFVPISAWVAREAAALRSRFNLKLPDALQLAAALTSGCDIFLTNDAVFQRVTELQVIQVNALTPDLPPGTPPAP